MIFALALIPLFGAVGALIDYTRVSDVRAELAAATDAGLLAVGSQPPMSDKDAYDTVDKWIETHVKPAYDGTWKLDSVVQEKGGRITATVSGEVKTTIAKILGIQTIPINITSEIVSSMGKVEVALVLDNTGSMASKNKIGKLKDAAEALVDTLANAVVDPERPQDRSGSLLADRQCRPEIQGCRLARHRRQVRFGQEHVPWPGSQPLRPFQRDGDELGRLRRDPRRTTRRARRCRARASPNTLYVPFFAPDEPGIQGRRRQRQGQALDYNNSYLDDKPVDTIKADLTAKGLSRKPQAARLPAA